MFRYSNKAFIKDRSRQVVFKVPLTRELSRYVHIALIKVFFN
jgi:hypothetical protein